MAKIVKIGSTLIELERVLKSEITLVEDYTGYYRKVWIITFIDKDVREFRPWNDECEARYVKADEFINEYLAKHKHKIFEFN